MVASWRMEPTPVDGARVALAVLADAAAAGQPFRLVLTDALMPDVDGFALARDIGLDPRLAGVKLIMLSSAHAAEGRPRAQAAGVAAYLSKPVKHSDLLDAIFSVFGPRTRTRPSSSRRRRTASQQPHPLRILVAEDNATNQKLVTTLLEQRGHRVVVAPNGRDAVARSAEGSFDVILMDVQMPEMSGLDATAAIRARERETGAHVPIAAMTAHAMTGDRERCLEAGMDAYLSKPLRPAELFATIDGLVAARPTSHVAARDRSRTEAGPEDTALDAAALIASFGGNRTLVREVIDVFLADCPAQLERIRQAVRARDAPALSAAAHAFKGSAGLFVQAGAWESARRLDLAAKDGDLTDVDAAFTGLERDVSVLRRTLRALAKRLRADHGLSQ